MTVVQQALILSVFGQDAMRNGKRQPKRLECTCNRLFTLGVGVRMQQADGNRFSAGLLSDLADLQQFRLIQRRRELAVEVSSPADSETHVARDQRLRPRRGERV